MSVDLVARGDLTPLFEAHQLAHPSWRSRDPRKRKLLLVRACAAIEVLPAPGTARRAGLHSGDVAGVRHNGGETVRCRKAVGC